jgi:hypothetical protein
MDTLESTLKEHISPRRAAGEEAHADTSTAPALGLLRGTVLDLK